MPYLDKIAAWMNNEIVSNAYKSIAPAKIKAYGISEVILDVREDEKGPITVRYPAMVNDDGEAKMIDIDDGYGIILYHKAEGITNAIASKSAYGDSTGNFLETANMSLMIYAFRKKIRKPVWWLEAAAKDQIRDTLTLKNQDETIQLQRSIIRFGNSSFDKLTLLQREYSQIELNYPNLIVLEIKYRIESTWKKGCFLNCNC